MVKWKRADNSYMHITGKQNYFRKLQISSVLKVNSSKLDILSWKLLRTGHFRNQRK